MRKPWLIKTVFAAAVIFTVFFTVLAFAEVVQFFALEIPVNFLIAMLIADVVCPFILWEVYYSLTHDSLGNKIKPSAEPVYKNTESEQYTSLPYTPTPEGRFVFDEDFFFEKMITIAKRFDLKLSYDKSDSWENFGVIWYEAELTGKYNFELSIHDDMISVEPVGLNVHNCYTFNYNFDFYDDAFSERKAHKYIYADRDFEFTSFVSDMMFSNMSDDEIFDILEKIIEALYGARFMKYETIETDDGKESFIFYLDAPDYYGYTETTEIGNVKFILNGGN